MSQILLYADWVTLNEALSACKVSDPCASVLLLQTEDQIAVY